MRGFEHTVENRKISSGTSGTGTSQGGLPLLGRRAATARKLGTGGSSQGLTLVELVVVVGLIAILAAMFTVNIRKIRAGFDLRNASSVAVSEVRRAQAAAIAEGTKYAVEFVLGKPGQLNTYRATSYSCVLPSCWTRIRSVSGLGWPPTVTVEAASSDPLLDCGAPPGSSGNKCVTFAFLGAPLAGGEVVLLRSETGGSTRIVVAPATGRVSAQ